MGDLTKNLSRHEFRCPCGCGFDTVDIELANVLQAAVNFFEKSEGRDVRIDITGGNRCRKHNDALRELFRSSNGLNGAKTAQNSQHIYGRAADHKLFYRDTNKQIPAYQVYGYLNRSYQDEVAVGLYLNRVHVDTRTDAGQRWDMT